MRKIQGFRGDTSTSGKVGKVRKAKGDYLWDVEGVTASCCGRGQAAHLLHDEGHWRALVQKAQLAVGVLLVTRVAVDASVQQRPVEVSHQRPNVPGQPTSLTYHPTSHTF